MKNTTKQKNAEKAVQKLIKLSLQQIENRLFEFFTHYLEKQYSIVVLDQEDDKENLIKEFREFYNYEID